MSLSQACTLYPPICGGSVLFVLRLGCLDGNGSPERWSQPSMVRRGVS
jgi:hypothetical protein